MALSIKGVRFGATNLTNVDDELTEDGGGGASGGSTCGIFNTITTDYITTATMDLNGAIMSTIAGTIPVGTTDLFSFTKGSFTSAFFRYHIIDSTTDCSRNGHLASTWTDIGISHTETSSPDVGDTEDVVLATCAAGATVILYATNSGGKEWDYKSNYTLL